MALAAGASKTGTSIKGRLARLVYLLPLVLVGGLLWAGWRVPELFTHSASFRLKALEVGGLHLLRGTDILTASGLQVGDNVFAVDLREVEARLERLPWIKQAVVVRKPPDRLVVHVVERRRLAWVDLGRVYGIDGQGVLLPGERMPQESYGELDLPVISGLSCVPDSLYPGAVVADSALTQILDWWRQASVADAEFCMNVSEIQPLANGGIRLRLVGDGLEVRLPADQVAKRLWVLKRLMKRVYRECPEPAYIDMRFAGQVVVGSKGGDKERSS